MRPKMAKRRSVRAARARYSTKLTSKYQATVPREIRKHLHLRKGDQIMYELLPDDTVIVRRVTPLDLDYFQALNATLSEWETAEDEQAYKDL
ncbi:MAG: type II toxin-antitoxin system PrlF family antitoxin [Chlamydiales bacterium]